MAGIAVNRHFPGLVLAAGTLIVAAAALFFHFLPRRGSPLLIPLTLFFGLGYLALAPWTSPRQTEHHIRHYLDNGPWQISGTICTPVADQGFRRQFMIDDLALARPSDKSDPLPVSGKLRCLVYGASKGLDTADRIRFAGRIHSFTNFNNPGGFDYRQYMDFEGIAGNTYTVSGRLTRIGRHTGSAAAAWLRQYRSGIAEMIDRAGSDPSRQVLAALILGDRDGIAPEVKDDFNRAGVSHLLAISGLHIGIVASVAFFVFRRMLSLFPFLLRRAWTARGAALLAILPVVLYGVLSGMSPSTQRAVIMVSVFMGTFLIQREHDLFNTLSVAALIILIIDPPALFSISFQLSFAAVLSIVTGLLLVRRNRANTKTLWRSVLGGISMFMCVSCFAILGTAPLVMAYFNQVSLMGLFANLVLIPLIGYLVVPAGLFSTLILYPLGEPAALWGLYMSGEILAVSLRIIEFFAGLPFAAFKTITPSWLEIGCIYGLMGILAWRYHRLSLTPRSTGAASAPILDKRAATAMAAEALSPWRRYLPAAAAGIILIILLADMGYWVNRRWFNDEFRITVMDVGQGNAAVLELPGGRCALIDGGGLSGNDVFDMGARIVAPYLWKNKIARVDTVFLTHPDADHLNGLVFICEHFGVRRVISNHQGADSREYRQLLEIVQRKKILHPAYEVMDRSLTIGGVVFEILHPPAGFMTDCPDSGALDTNNSSMMIRAGYHGRHVLFPGDIYTSGEQRAMAACKGQISAHILMVPHHGSKTSCSEAFIRAVNPRAAVISAGRNNRFGFPDPAVVNRLSDHGCEIFMTKDHGALRIIIDEGKTAIIPMTGEPAVF